MDLTSEVHLVYTIGKLSWEGPEGGRGQGPDTLLNSGMDPLK